MTTALELISRALRLANILGEGQIPSADMANNALDTLNGMTGSFNLDSLALLATANVQVATVANQSLYTIGTGGNWATTRPVQINSMYVDFGGVSYPISEVNQQEFNLIVLKGMLGAFIPRFFLYVPEHPLGLVTLWPAPNQVLPLTISVDRYVPDITSLATVIVSPPGYERLIVSSLAIELSPEYGREPSAQLQKIARDALARVKQANHIPVVAEFDPSILGGGGASGLAAFLSGSY